MATSTMSSMKVFTLLFPSCGCYGNQNLECKKTPDNLTRSVVPTMAQPRGPLENDDVHEQKLTKLHHEVDDDSTEIVAKESREINAVHGD